MDHKNMETKMIKSGPFLNVRGRGSWVARRSPPGTGPTRRGGPGAGCAGVAQLAQRYLSYPAARTCNTVTVDLRSSLPLQIQ